MSARKLIFDTLFTVYTLCLIGYAATGFSLTEEVFIAQFTPLMQTFGVLTALTVLGAYAAHRLSIYTVGELLFAKEGARAAPALTRSFWGAHLGLTLLLTIIVSLRVTDASFGEMLDAHGLEGAWRLTSGLLQPNFSLLPKAIAQAGETIFIAFLATVLAVPVAFLLAFFAAKNIMRGSLALTVYSTLRLGLNITRSVEPLIWALIFAVWVGVGPFAGMLALMVHSIASLIKYYSEIIESVDHGPIDGVRSTGANEIQVIWYAIVPQIVLPYIAMTAYRWDTNVRMATVIGLAGGGGIGTLLIQYQGQGMWPEVGCIFLVIAIIVWLMDTASAYIREALK